MGFNRLGLVVLCFLLTVLATDASAVDDIFSGAIDDTWENPTNWSLGVVPEDGDQVVIPVSSNVTLNSTSADLAGLTVEGTLEVGSTSSGTLCWAGTQTWGGSGTITFTQGTLYHDTDAPDVLTLSGPNITCLLAELGENFGTPSTLHIQCPISDTGSLELLGTWACTGSISLSNTASVTLDGSFSSASASTITIGSHCSVEIAGTMDNTGATFTFSGSAGTSTCQMMGAACIIGGTIAATDGPVTLNVGSGELDGTTLASGTTVSVAGSLLVKDGLTMMDGTAQVSVAPGDELVWSGTQTISGGQINLLGTNAAITNLDTSGTPILTLDSMIVDDTAGVTSIGGGSVGSIVNAGTIDIDGLSISLGIPGTFTNQGAIQVQQGATLSLAGSWSNTGTIAGNDSVIALGGQFATSSVAGISSANGNVVDLQGSLANTGATLALGSSTGQWMLDGGTITGGSITTTGGDDLIATAAGGVLDGVTVNAASVIDLTQPAAQATITGGMTVNGTILIGADSGSSANELLWTGTQTWSGSGNIVLGDLSDQVVHGNTLPETLTVVPPLSIGLLLTITANNLTVGYGTSAPTYTYTATGLQGTDTIASVALTSAATSTSPVGTYAITPSAAVLGSGNADPYTIVYQPGTLTISSSAVLTITANNQIMTSGSALPAFTASYAGFVNGDTSASLTVQPTFTTTATPSSPAGSYPITVSGAQDPNYAIAYAPGLLIVTAAETPAGIYGTGVDDAGSSGSGSSGGCGLGGAGAALLGCLLLGFGRSRSARAITTDRSRRDHPQR